MLDLLTLAVLVGGDVLGSSDAAGVTRGRSFFGRLTSAMGGGLFRIVRNGATWAWSTSTDGKTTADQGTEATPRAALLVVLERLGGFSFLEIVALADSGALTYEQIQQGGASVAKMIAGIGTVAEGSEVWPWHAFTVAGPIASEMGRTPTRAESTIAMLDVLARWNLLA